MATSEQFKAQRETCWRICSGQFLHRPGPLAIIVTSITVLGMVTAGVYAYWADSIQVRERVSRIEQCITEQRTTFDDLRRAFSRFESRSEDQYEKILDELKTIRGR